jgi:hypothetical protein
MKNKLVRDLVCFCLAMFFLMPLTIPTGADDPVDKYAIIVAGGASAKLGQVENCGDSSSPYKGTYAYYTDGSSWTNYNLYFDFNIWDSDATADHIGVMFRYQNNDNYYRLRIKNYYSNDYIYLEKFVNGNFYSISSTSYTVDRNTWYTYKIQLSGSSISVWKQTSAQLWQSVISTTDNSFSNGTIALYSCRCAGAWFDDLLVRSSGMFFEQDFERKEEGVSATSVYPGSPVKWNEIDDNGSSDWQFSDSQEDDNPFVEDPEDFYTECDDLYNLLVDYDYTVRYLSVDRWSDPDDDDYNEIYDVATSSSIEDAYSWMAQNSDSNDKCLIYMFDHGYYNILNNKGFLYIDNNRDGDRQDSSDRLYDDTVADWVDDIDSYGTLIFVLEACFAGRFTYDVGYNSDDRIVITSTDSSHAANPWYDDGDKTDWPVFSKHLFERLDDGYSFKDAYNYAGDAVDDNNDYYDPGVEYQYPMCDDDGDGAGHQHDLPNGGDGSLAASTYL